MPAEDTPLNFRRRPAVLGGEPTPWWSWFFRRVEEGVVDGLVSFCCERRHGLAHVFQGALERGPSCMLLIPNMHCLRLRGGVCVGGLEDIVYHCVDIEPGRHVNQIVLVIGWHVWNYYAWIRRGSGNTRRNMRLYYCWREHGHVLCWIICYIVLYRTGIAQALVHSLLGHRGRNIILAKWSCLRCRIVGEVRANRPWAFCFLLSAGRVSLHFER